jgi:diguanylate cyclase (GGDEF)-like protein
MANLFTRISQGVSRTTSHPAPGPVGAPAGSPATGVAAAEQAAAAMGLAREVLHAVEQFVISTPDLDTGRLLHRMRGTAAGLNASTDSATLCLYRDWCKCALEAFGTLQRAYVGEREEEMWRLLDAINGAIEAGRTQRSGRVEEIQQAHQRMRAAASINDIREAREQIQTELNIAVKTLELKAREDKERVAGLARQVSRLQAELAEVRGRARYDVLTGLFHRGTLLERLQETLAAGKPCSVAILDLDNFKTINDSLGHAVADRLLFTVAQQIQRSARTVDIVGRFGGDEFCLIAPGFTPEQLAQRLGGVVMRRHVKLEMEERVCSVLLSLSVGISSSAPGEVPAPLLERADQALRSVKRAGKGGIRITRPTSLPKGWGTVAPP